MAPEEHTKSRGFGVYVTGVVVLVAAALGAGIVAHARRSSAETERRSRVHEVEEGPRVRVTTVGESVADRSIELLGESRAFYSTTLYAKISGYLREIRVDRGDTVHRNQLLAIIESPEVDQQVRAASADLVNRRLYAARQRSLVMPGFVAQQDADTADANARIGFANLGTVAAQQSYRYIRAPFDGMVTARYADPGALLQSATGSQTSALPVIRVGDVSRLRVFVYPEQRDVAFIHQGDPAQVTVVERPGLVVHATVTRMTGELDTRTRTQLTEIDIDNRDAQITPGSFVQVSVRVRTPAYPLIPAEALVMRGSQTWVATVDAQDTVHYRRVQLVDDDGLRVRVLSGVHTGERVALSLGDSVEDGSRIRALAVPSPALPSAPPAPGASAPGAGAPVVPAIRR